MNSATAATQSALAASLACGGNGAPAAFAGLNDAGDMDSGAGGGPGRVFGERAG